MSGESMLAGDPGPLGTYSDAARRIADTHNLHQAVNGTTAVGKWIACRLSDGVSDDTLYDTRTDAVRHQLHEKQCAYVQIQPEHMSYRDAASYLAFVRHVYDAGLSMPDPDNPEREIMPTYQFQQLRDRFRRQP